MLTKPVLYPYGYRAFQPGTYTRPSGRTEGDQEVARLYRGYYRQEEGWNTFEFKIDVMRSAIRLFGDSFFSWALQQLDNGYLNDKAIRCIADTVRFIATGNRDLAIIHWETILDDNPVEDKSPSSKLRVELREQLQKMLSVDGPGFLYRWLRQANGFDDLLVSLDVFFGPDRNPEDRNAIINPSPKNPQTQRLTKLLNS